MQKALTIDIRPVMFMTMVAGMLLILSLPLASHAQGKPDVTGQERAEMAKNNGAGSASSSEAEHASNAETGSEAANNKGDNAARGLERAASAGNKPEEIRSQLNYILLLISQIQDAVDGRGIGKELSEFIANGRTTPDDTDDGDDTSDEMDTSLITASLLDSTEALVENSTTTDEDNEGTFEMTLEVTASSSDVMIPEGAGTDAGTSTGIVFSIRDASSTVVTTGTTSATLASTATEDGGEYTVLSGETETFTLTVTFDPEDMGDYFVQLETITVDGEAVEFVPESDFNSAPLSI